MSFDQKLIVPIMREPLAAAQSSVHGTGVIANDGFHEGDVIAQLSGQLMRGSSAQSDPNYIGIGPDTWIDPAFPFSLINHHCEPNAAFGRHRTIYALRAIAVGEEITIDYSTTEADIGWTMPCACRAATCRKILHAIQVSFPSKGNMPNASPLMQLVWRKRSRQIG